MEQLTIYGIRIDGQDSFDHLHLTKESALISAAFLKMHEKEPSKYEIMEVIVFDESQITEGDTI